MRQRGLRFSLETYGRRDREESLVYPPQGPLGQASTMYRAEKRERGKERERERERGECLRWRDTWRIGLLECAREKGLFAVKRSRARGTSANGPWLAAERTVVEPAKGRRLNTWSVV
ncbi:uncharacterized protein MCYG_02816 [Microsporum canis CBS 113480]|uniref:Uncharacterized protein n=1 Tax=Arthroderma otae (strain ATCC MYA-4605 / CBS 113480) TaxID=554155 RepID=C5FGW2_ARTOC|nr:uncharacterized protein MCYG_02816 [Microsporum canis CBS 113480]EEQ29997.1 predicted protein [Microsporum canis CBS 113480]